MGAPSIWQAWAGLLHTQIERPRKMRAD